MKKLKKLTVLCLTTIMVFSLFGCSKNNNDGSTKTAETVKGETSTKEPETKKAVKLEWWYRGNGVQKDTELVEGKVNELLKTYEGLENVTINLNCYTGSEYQNAVLLAQSAGKQIDILNTVSINFTEEVEKGTFISINDSLETLPELKSELPDWLWELGSVDGKIYMVPNYQRASNMTYFVTPKAYMDKYGDIDNMRKVFQNTESSVKEISTVLENYGTAVKAGEGKTKYMPPMATMYYSTYGFTNFFDKVYNDFYKFSGKDKVENIYTSDEIKEAYAVSADWYKKGLVHPDILTINMNDFQGKNMLNDISFIFTMNNQAGDEERVSKVYTTMYGFDVYAVPVNSKYYITNAWAAGGNGVTASSKNPEEALNFIEALTTEKGKEIYNLMVYGVEGKHYEKIDDSHIKTLEYTGTQGGVDTSYSGMKWIIGNTFNAYLNQASTDDENEIALEINSSEKNMISDLMGFTAKTDAVAIQLEQIAAVTTEYSKPLIYGAFGDKWENAYNEYVKKMEAAGLNKVVSELQIQIDTFLKK